MILMSLYQKLGVQSHSVTARTKDKSLTAMGIKVLVRLWRVEVLSTCTVVALLEIQHVRVQV